MNYLIAGKKHVWSLLINFLRQNFNIMVKKKLGKKRTVTDIKYEAKEDKGWVFS